MLTSLSRQHAGADIDLTFQLAGVGLCIARQHVIQRCDPLYGYRADELVDASLACLYPSGDEFVRSGATARCFRAG